MKRTVSLALSLIMIVASITALPFSALADDTKIESVSITYDTSRAVLNPSFTCSDWSSEFVSTLGTASAGIVLLNNNTSNNRIVCRTASGWAVINDNEELISTEKEYWLRMDIHAATGYYYDTANDNYKNVEVILNGVKRTDAIIDSYNDYWKGIKVYIPVAFDFSERTFSITISQDTNNVTKGTTKEFTSKVRYYGAGYDAITWEVSGATSADTKFTGGTLFVGEDETASSLRVKAKSALNPSVESNQLTVNVLDKPLTIESVVISPKQNVKVYRGYTKQFSVSVTGTAAHDVVWSIAETPSSAVTSVSASGLLTVGEDETLDTLTVRVTSTADPSKYDEAVAAVLNPIKIESVYLTYNTESAVLSTAYTYEQFNSAFVNSVRTSEGTALINNLTSNNRLVFYTDTGWATVGNINDYVDCGRKYAIRVNINSATGYYYDTTDKNYKNVVIYVNGEKRDDAVIDDYYNEYWKNIIVYIPINVIHPLETVPAKAATCAEAGNKAYYHCTGCGKYFADEAGTQETTVGAQSVPATGVHTPKEAVKENEVAATYTAEGSYDSVVYCSVCGEEISRTPVTVDKLEKKANTLTVKGRTVKIKANEKAVIKKEDAFTVKKAKGTVTFKKAAGNKKITVARNGKITVKKGMKKGVYKVKIKVTAAGNDEYKKAVKTVTVTIKVK